MWASPYITESERLSFWDATYQSGKIIADTPGLLKDALIQNPGDAVAGPVGTGQVAVEILKYGVSNIIFLAALISLGIGVFNIFPIPPLDGGGIVIAADRGGSTRKTPFTSSHAACLYDRNCPFDNLLYYDNLQRCPSPDG